MRELEAPGQFWLGSLQKVGRVMEAYDWEKWNEIALLPTGPQI